jgi:hypothetical protein
MNPVTVVPINPPESLASRLHRYNRYSLLSSIMTFRALLPPSLVRPGKLPPPLCRFAGGRAAYHPRGPPPAPDRLTDNQLNELYVGRFPANYPDEVIHLIRSPTRTRHDLKRIFDAFDPSLDQQEPP